MSLRRQNQNLETYQLVYLVTEIAKAISILRQNTSLYLFNLDLTISPVLPEIHLYPRFLHKSFKDLLY